MFTDKKNFTVWLEKQENTQFSRLSDYLNEQQKTELYKLYQDCLDMDSYSLNLVVQKMGSAIAGLVQFVALVDTIDTGARKKAFVMETVSNLYRLIDKGIDGMEDNIDKEVVDFSAYGVSTEEDFQAMFADMADQTIESFWNG